MKKIFALLVCFIFILVSVLNESFAGDGSKKNNKRSPVILEEINPDLSIHEGYVSLKKETVRIVRNGKVVAKVKLGKPVMVAQAEQEEEWGYFQFPGICRSDDGKLIVSWMMNEDSHKAYDKGEVFMRMSTNEGRTWKPLDQDYFIRGFLSFDLKNGDVIQIHNPPSKNINDYSNFPRTVCRDPSLNMVFYMEKELPGELRGTYLNIRNGQNKQISQIHGELDDPGLMRYAIDDYMPLMWWGDIRELTDGSLIGGIYRTYYLNQDEGYPKSCITFYHSNDGGYHWKSIGKIPYQIEEIANKERQYDNTKGFSESSFLILNDSTLFCVIRTGYNTPMYKAYSYDVGKHWSEPKAFTPNGVRPQLLHLDNGIIVLASGRPGVQLRFCIDGDGENWTEPIEMLPFMNEDGGHDIWGATCGYSRLLKVDNNTFYLVYSDFKTKNSKGELRKSIMFRKIAIIKR